MIRQPAVAGRFYPGTNDELVATIQEYLRPSETARRVIGAVIPHAGYMYSGHVAGAVYSQIQPSNQVIVLCPNHTGLGPELSIMPAGFWQTPLGQIAVDEPLSRALMAAVPHYRMTFWHTSTSMRLKCSSRSFSSSWEASCDSCRLRLGHRDGRYWKHWATGLAMWSRDWILDR
jgi:hypothetical protein